MHTDRKGKGDTVSIFKCHDYVENPKKFTKELLNPIREFIIASS